MPPARPHPDETSSKRQKSNFGSALKKPPGPDVQKGIQYWDGIEASVDGVLGGFGNGPVPHIDQLSSRLFLISLLPNLQTFQSPLTPFPPPRVQHRLTVLDVGAGIGRVSKEVLTPLFDDVVLLEPVAKFVEEAYRSAGQGEWRHLSPSTLTSNSTSSSTSNSRSEGTGSTDPKKKRVWFVKGALQGFDPAFPLASSSCESLGVIGSSESDHFGERGDEVQYDAIWCQWCLGHMTHSDLVIFLKKARQALRPPSPDPPKSIAAVGGYESLIFVKENVCEDGPEGKPSEFLDEEDSSLTRSNGRWLEVFSDAGLEVVKEEIQEGMPSELFVVKTWALR